MQFRRARFLLSASTMYQGAFLRSRVLEHDVLRLASTRPSACATSRSIGLSFQRLIGLSHALLEAPLLLLVADREPVLDQDDPRAHEHLLEQRAGAQEFLVLVVGAEAHDVLDAGAVVPAAIEQHDLAGRGQVRRRSAGSTTGRARARWASAARRRGRRAG